MLGPECVKGGEASIYVFAKLLDGVDDMLCVEWLIKKHGVATIPGTSCGSPGYIRVAYANTTSEQCIEACRRLRGGLQAVVDGADISLPA